LAYVSDAHHGRRRSSPTVGVRSVFACADENAGAAEYGPLLTLATSFLDEGTLVDTCGGGPCRTVTGG